MTWLVVLGVLVFLAWLFSSRSQEPRCPRCEELRADSAEKCACGYVYEPQVDRLSAALKRRELEAVQSSSGLTSDDRASSGEPASPICVGRVPSENEVRAIAEASAWFFALEDALRRDDAEGAERAIREGIAVSCWQTVNRMRRLSRLSDQFEFGADASKRLSELIDALREAIPWVANFHLAVSVVHAFRVEAQGNIYLMRMPKYFAYQNLVPVVDNVMRANGRSAVVMDHCVALREASVAIDGMCGQVLRDLTWAITGEAPLDTSMLGDVIDGISGRMTVLQSALAVFDGEMRLAKA